MQIHLVLEDFHLLCPVTVVSVERGGIVYLWGRQTSPTVLTIEPGEVGACAL